MCGIVGYVGNKEAAPYLLDGLKRMEYRGYDSAGIAVLDGKGEINVEKRAGKVEILARCVSGISGKCGIGHTRWATHGKPCKKNSHPHRSGKFVVVHNGIIENFLQLKIKLTNDGVKFSSETDTEVIVHLLNRYYDGDLLATLKKVSEKLVGTFALAALCEDYPDCIALVKRQNPIIVGFGDGECFVASDIPAIVPHTNRICRLEENEIAIVSAGETSFFDSELRKIEKNVEIVNISPDSLEMGSFETYMRKEISEAPAAIKMTADSIVAGKNGENYKKFLSAAKSANKIVFIGCGTAYHSSVVAKYVIEKLARMPVECDLASEFRYKDPIIDGNTVFFAISQSGETADTIAAARLVKEKGAFLAVLTNVQSSTLTTFGDSVFCTCAGVEIGVAATKSYASQLAALYALAFGLAEHRQGCDLTQLTNELLGIHKCAEKVVSAAFASMKRYAGEFSDKSSIFFIGRNLDYAISLEGSLKLKEISYIHSEGYAAGELKHGTLALIDEASFVIAVTTQSQLAEKTENAIHEVLARGASVGIITNMEKYSLENYRNDNNTAFVFSIPKTSEILSPILSVIPLQVFAYYVARSRGLDPDKPRNLAKSVTVE